MDKYLGVTMGIEAMTDCFEILTQCDVIENLTVVDDPIASVRSRHRLLPDAGSIILRRALPKAAVATQAEAEGGKCAPLLLT